MWGGDRCSATAVRELPQNPTSHWAARLQDTLVLLKVPPAGMPSGATEFGKMEV